MKARLVASQGDEEAGKAYGCRRPVLTTTCSCKSKSMSARLGHLPSDHISPVMRMVCWGHEILPSIKHHLLKVPLAQYWGSRKQHISLGRIHYRNHGRVFMSYLNHCWPWCVILWLKQRMCFLAKSIFKISWLLWLANCSIIFLFYYYLITNYIQIICLIFHECHFESFKVGCGITKSRTCCNGSAG